MAWIKWFEPQKKTANVNFEKQLNNIEQYETDKNFMDYSDDSSYGKCLYTWLFY